MRIAVDNTNPPATLSDLAIFGMDLGLLIAQRLIRGYAVTPIQPDLSPAAVILLGDKLVDDFVRKQRATNNLTSDGESHYRQGYARGLKSQLKHPSDTLEIERVKEANGGARIQIKRVKSNV